MSDYARIADAIRFIASQVARQPTLDEIAAHVHLSPFHFQRLFSRWAGVTPKRYLQVLTLERAKALLQESRPLLEVADTLGLSSGSRLYDHFVQLEAVTPGEYKQRGAGLVIEKREVAHPPRGQGDERLTEGCVVHPVIDNQPGPALLVLARRHRFKLHEVIVEPRAAAKAQGVGHLQQGARFVQHPPSPAPESAPANSVWASPRPSG